MNHRIALLFIFFVFALSFPIGPSHADDERLSFEWIFSEERKAADSVPDHHWLHDGTLLLYDHRKEKTERTIESFNPRNQRRRRVVDARKVVAALNSLLKPDEPIKELDWPDTIDASGRFAAYEIGGDIVLLDLRTSSVSAVSVTDADELAPRFSPDGQWLAYVRDHDLYAWHIADGETIRLTSDGSDTVMNGTVSWVYWEELLNRADRGYVWAPDSSAIAYLQTDDGPVGVMHYVDFEPNLPRLVRQRHPKPGSANPRVRAGVVTLAEKQTTWLDLGAYPYEYLARIQWLPSGRRLAVQTLNRPQTVLDVFIAEAGDGTARHLMRETNTGWINVHDDLHFINEEREFIWLSERDGHAHLYRYNMDGELVNPVTRGNWAVKPSGGPAGMDRAVSHIDDAAGSVWFTALEKDSTERHLYRIGIDGSGLERVTRRDGAHAIWFSPAGNYYLDRYSSLETPPELTVHAASGEPVATVAEAVTAVAERFDLQPWERLSIEARDGYPMPAMLLKPRFFDPQQRYPALVYVYGGPSAPTVVNAWQGRARGYYHQLLADNGVVIFYVDNRSAAGRSKSDANSIVRQLYGPVELNDLLDGVTWLKSQPYIDAERIGVWGWSGGGTMTLQAMTSSKAFAAGAAVAPVTDWHYYDTIYTERYMKRPADNPQGYEQTSHVKRASELHGRLLLVHGTYDDNVHPQNSWAFADGLIEAGITFDMMIYPMRKHGIRDDAAQLHVFKTMAEFWERQLALGDRIRAQ